MLNADYKLPSAQERMLASWAQAHPPDFVSLLQGKPAEYAAQPVAPQWIENGWADQTLREGLRQTVGKPVDTLPIGYAARDYRWLASYDFTWGPLLTIEFLARGNLEHQPSETSRATYEAAVAPQFDKTKSPSDAEKQNADIIHFLEGTLRSQIGFGLPNDTESVPDRIPAPLFVLGQEAVEWWTNEQEATDRCLKTLPNDVTAPTASVRLPDPKATRETVMELHPRAELWQAHGGANETAPTLASWVHPIQGADYWSVREKEGVLLITNRLAFMERPQNVPLGEWLHFADEVRTWREKNATLFAARDEKANGSDRAFMDGFLPSEPLANYARAVTSRRDGRTWRALGNMYDSRYHGAALSTLDFAVPAVFLWSKLSEKERALLLSSLDTPAPNVSERSNRGRFSLSQFGDGTLLMLARLLRERSTKNADPQNRDYIAYLRSCILEVVSPADPKVTVPSYQLVQASIVSDFDAGILSDQLSSVRFVIVAPPLP